jgi:hypothetical protein
LTYSPPRGIETVREEEEEDEIQGTDKESAASDLQDLELKDAFPPHKRSHNDSAIYSPDSLTTAPKVREGDEPAAKRPRLISATILSEEDASLPDVMGLQETPEIHHMPATIKPVVDSDDMQTVSTYPSRTIDEDYDMTNPVCPAPDMSSPQIPRSRTPPSATTSTLAATCGPGVTSTLITTPSVPLPVQDLPERARATGDRAAEPIVVPDTEDEDGDKTEDEDWSKPRIPLASISPSLKDADAISSDREIDESWPQFFGGLTFWVDPMFPYRMQIMAQIKVSRRLGMYS